MYCGLRGSDSSIAEGWEDCLRYLTMFDGIFLPDKAPKIFPTVVEIRLDEGLQTFLMGRVNVCDRQYMSGLFRTKGTICMLHLPIDACGVMKTSSLGAMRTTSPYSLRVFSIAQGYLPESLQSSLISPYVSIFKMSHTSDIRTRHSRPLLFVGPET